MAMLTIAAPNIHAQEKDDTITLLDTLIDVPSVVTASDDTTFYFDNISVAPYIHLRSVPDSLVNTLKNNPDFWYANTAPVKMKKTEAKEQPSEGISFYRQPWFKTMLWIFIIGTFVAVLIWYLEVSNVRLFRKSAISISNASKEVETNDIYSINYDTDIKNALNTNNYRLAIRLLYLQTLKLMADKDIIQYKAEKTNSDYLWQLQGTAFYKDFFRLTRDFDYTWYGKFDISAEAFQTILKDFTSFNNRI
ncbi:DUF4129 domain-containing protein [Chitinophagaceae bacterium LB-8]|uniref:DUF4129 domain-containing protein n=1 Tax=Paraflavisolibacter caeni TaxID=2982496 RepID=A0A9X2XTH8_9BACT|nr:DUF4129 domain-containing protein [Paraflavisolibacter caeni]MCU7548944.1 DUF4129 domain-containing protein [Paraflavisolibacter caeni]